MAISRRQILGALAGSALAAIPAWPGLAAVPARRAEALFAELDRWLATHLPEVAADLNPGASDAALDRFAAAVDVVLPPDFRALYRWHDGQKGRAVGGPWYGLGFQTLQQVQEDWSLWAKIVDDSVASDPEFLTEFQTSVVPGVVKPLYASKRWVPFAQDWGGNHLGIDLDPDVKGVAGQVINFGRDEEDKRAIAPSITAFVEWMLGELRRGNFSIERRPDGRVFNTLRPPSQHFLDAIPTLFPGPGDRKRVKPAGTPAPACEPGAAGS